MDGVIDTVGYGLGSLVGHLQLGGPLMWATMLASGAFLPRIWMVAAAVGAYVIGTAVVLGMDPLLDAPFTLVAACALALLGRLTRLIAMRRRAA